MTYDPTYCRRERQALYRRRRLTVLVFACAFSLAVFGLSTGPTDVEIRDGNVEATR